MDKATLSMIENLYKNTGKSLDHWIGIVKEQGLTKHGDIIKYLKEQHAFTHGFANLVAHKANETDAGSAVNQMDLIQKQYKGKEHFITMYNTLIETIQKFGNDIEIAPKVSYVSLRRKKQFATLFPATKKRFEVGINLKGQAPKGRLEAEKPNAMCSHKICLSAIGEIDEEVLGWIKTAYEHAG